MPSRLLVLDRRNTLVEHLQAIVEELWPVPEVVGWSELGSVADALADDGPFDVLVAGPSLATRNGLARLRVIREELPAMPIVLAFSKRPDASIRDIVRAGAVDIVRLPAADDELLDAIERAFAISLVEHEAGEPGLPAEDWPQLPFDEPEVPRVDPSLVEEPAVAAAEPSTVEAPAAARAQPPIGEESAVVGDEPPILEEPALVEELIVDAAHDAEAERLVTVASPERPIASPDARPAGRVLSIASAAHGNGKTFLATNLACALAQREAGAVCLVDLDLRFAGVTTALALDPDRTIADALYDADTGAAELHQDIARYTVPHRTGVDVLAAPADPEDADHIHPEDVTHVLEAARHHFDWVVVDTPPTLSEPALAAFDVSTHLCAVATLDLGSLRELHAFLDTLQRLGVAGDGIRLALNQADPAADIDIEEITRLFPRGFDAVLPEDAAVSRAAAGIPVVAAAPTAEVSRLLLAAVARLAGDEDPRSQATGAKAGKRRRLSLRR